MRHPSFDRLLILFAALFVITAWTCTNPAEPGPILRLTRCEVYYARTNTAFYDLCQTCQENPDVTEFTSKGTEGSVHYYIRVHAIECVAGEPVRYKVTWLPTGDTYAYPPYEEESDEGNTLR